MPAFVKQFCFLNDDEHRRYLSYLKSIAKAKGQSESQVVYQAIKIYVDKQVPLLQIDLLGFTKEDIPVDQINKPKPKIACRDCGASESEVDENGLLIHRSTCPYFDWYEKRRLEHFSETRT